MVGETPEERSDDSDHGELKRVVNAFPQMLDAYEGKSLLIGATNHERILDTAVWRRFDEVLLFEPPNLEQIRRLLGVKLRGLRREFNPEDSRIAGLFKGMSHADVERVIRRAAKDMILAGQEFLTERHLNSQEGDEIVLAFVSEAALESFEALLTTLAEGGVPTNQQVFFALRGIDGWRPQDRMGWALRTEGFPAQEAFNLDIELWPPEDNPREREALWRAFEEWLADKDVAKLDNVKQPGLTLFRVRCDRTQAESLLHHRGVRTVDLTPR